VTTDDGYRVYGWAVLQQGFWCQNDRGQITGCASLILWRL